MQAGWRCATEYREPCQAGNRAALNGFFRAMQLVCRSAYYSISFMWNWSGRVVSSFVSQVATAVL